MNKKIKGIISIIILLMLVYIFVNTYSKYTNDSSARIEQDIAVWKIKINDEDITSLTGEPVEFEITNFEWDESVHVKEGKVAPGMKGEFELIIDPTDTDTSIKYSIVIDDSKFTEANDINLKIKSITVDGETYSYTSEENETGDGTQIEIAIVKPLSEIQSNDANVRKDTILVKVEWENNEDNNEKDSEIGSIPDNVIRLPISVDVIQYTGEIAPVGNEVTNEVTNDVTPIENEVSP